MKLTELEPEFYRYETRVEEGLYSNSWNWNAKLARLAVQ